MMFDICHSPSKGCSPSNSGSLRKPLVALSVLVLLVAMCLSAADAAPRPAEHRRRHRPAAPPAAPPAPPAPLAPPAPPAPPRPRRAARAEAYRNTTRLILQRLKYTESLFKRDIAEYRGRATALYRYSGNPSWLPKVNFVSIHQHQLRGPERRVKYILPRLYKHLSAFRAVFARLRSVEVVSGIERYLRLRRRRELLNKTVTNLELALLEVTDAMDRLNMTRPADAAADLAALRRVVDVTKCDYQDELALRGYENLLSLWWLEIKCLPQRRGRLRDKCRDYEQRLRRRRDRKAERRKPRRRPARA